MCTFQIPHPFQSPQGQAAHYYDSPNGKVHAGLLPRQHTQYYSLFNLHYKAVNPSLMSDRVFIIKKENCSQTPVLFFAF